MGQEIVMEWIDGALPMPPELQQKLKPGVSLFMKSQRISINYYFSLQSMRYGSFI